MSQERVKPVHDPFKHFKFLVFATDKSSDVLMTSLKAATLVVFIVTTVSLILYSVFGGAESSWFRCPECPSRYIYNTTENSPPESSGPTNISHIVFGIGGSSNTWRSRMQYSKLWWQPNTTRGYVWLEEKPDPKLEWAENVPPYRVSEDWSRFKGTTSGSASAIRIARIVLESFRFGLPDVRWFVMGDDDTVFFTENLVSVLGKYDHRRMYYVGGNSESVEQDVMHSYGMAFGGGGIAVSYPLAAELVKVLDGCIDRYNYFYGSDQRVWACITEIGISLTKELGFHQFDIRDDPYGILAAHPVAPLVTFHHLDYVKPLFPNKTQVESLTTLIQAYKLDPARTMQQFICYYKTWRRKWSVSISWGYSVQLYSMLLSATDLHTPLQTFRTWRSWGKGPFTFNTRPISPDPCQQPFIYYLDWVKEVVGKNATLTSYTKDVVEPGTEKKCVKPDYRRAVEKIVVSAPKMDPEEIIKTQHRQSCEVSSLKYGKMKIKIRSFRPSKTADS